MSTKTISNNATRSPLSCDMRFLQYLCQVSVRQDALSIDSPSWRGVPDCATRSVQVNAGTVKAFADRPYVAWVDGSFRGGIPYLPFIAGVNAQEDELRESHPGR